MSFTITIKRGEGDPTGLVYGELAYDSLNHRLFVGLPDDTPFVLADHYSYCPYTGAMSNLDLGTNGVVSSGISYLTTLKADHIGEKTVAHMVTFDNTASFAAMYVSNLYNSGSSNYGRITCNQGSTYGFEISRNMADAVPIVRFKQLHASGTGYFWECLNAGGAYISYATLTGIVSASFTSDLFKHYNQTFTVNAGSLGNAERSLMPMLTDAYSDVFIFKNVQSLEYYDQANSTWTAETASDAQVLFDGHNGTVLTRTPDKRKWRVTVDAGTWLTAGVLLIGQEWVNTWGSADLAVTVENSSDLTNWTTVSTFNVTRYSSNSRRIYHALTDHSTRNYWRITFESSSATYNSAFSSLSLLSTDPNARGYRGGWPISTSFDKTVTFAGQVAATSFKAGTAAGIDATINYRKSDGVTNGTLTFTKGLLTAQT